MSEQFSETDETEFINNVQRNLREAKVLLAIVGDGIRENTEELTGFIQNRWEIYVTLDSFSPNASANGCSLLFRYDHRLLHRNRRFLRLFVLDRPDRSSYHLSAPSIDQCPSCA